jgi:SPP1 gp7 family putative phage head morphogenesis protein
VFDAAAIEASFHLMLVRVREGAPMHRAIGALQDAWGYPIAKADTTGGPGDHPGHAEIGRQELSYYRLLTENQKKALADIASIVDQLYAANGGTWQGIDPWKATEPLDEWKMRTMTALALEPMKAYLIGQSLATAASADLARRLGRGGNQMMRPVLAEDRRIIEFLGHYSFSEIDSKLDHLKHELRNQLIGGIATGSNPKEVARAMRNINQDFTTDFERIAVTETSRAESAGRLQEYLDQGYSSVVGSSAHDPSTCDHCLRLIDGKVHRIEDLIGKSNFRTKTGEWGPYIPVHPSCRCLYLPWTAELARAA